MNERKNNECTYQECIHVIMSLFSTYSYIDTIMMVWNCVDCGDSFSSAQFSPVQPSSDELRTIEDPVLNAEVG